uniref:Mab-21 domain-containing protein n=2 Tax=Macrostomum lignano TaxID=282301 RepID=A0A1I8GDQ2_9PLAT
MGKKTSLRDDIRQEWRTVAENLRGKRVEMYDRTKTMLNDVLIYRDMPRPDQLLPPMVEEFMENGLAMEPTETRPSIEVPEHFYNFSSPETNFMLSLLLDANDSRLRRLLNQVHTRALFKEDRYYQIVDDPTLYIRGTGCVDFPAFHNKVVMYLTATGIMIFLKCTTALTAAASIFGKGVSPRTPASEKAREARQPKRKKPQSEFAAVRQYEAKKKDKLLPLFNVYAFQYATYVHCTEGDILRFQLDYLAIKRHYYDAFPWIGGPNSPSMIMYRRRYFQFMTPFLDWVDLIRYIMKKSPTVSASTIYERMINSHNDNITLGDMKYLGQTMLECFEIRKLSKANCKLKAYYGVYVGRKILKDKEPQTHADYKEAFGQGLAVRPVIPHACSPTRRFLVHLYYYDKASMSTMAQVVSVVDFMLKQDFFSMHPLCKLSTIHLEPIIFQIYDFVWMIRKDNIGRKQYLRHETWESIRANDEAYAWYLRWDVLNCVSLLFGICQNALIKDLNESVIDRLVTLIIEVLRSSEYLESVMSYSFFDTYFGLTSTVNCVPNLQSRCVLRVLKKLPLYLVENFTSPALLGMFTHRFWRGASDQQKPPPRTLEEIGEFLVLRNRRMSMKTAAEGGGEAMSGTSAMGAGGAVTLFFREYESMPEITAEDEQAMDNDRNDNTRKEEEERVHVADYKRQETDFRYSQIFTDSFFQATGRPRIFYDENAQMKMCKQRSKELFKPQ